MSIPPLVCFALHLRLAVLVRPCHSEGVPVGINTKP
jgi:hypothetical protein